MKKELCIVKKGSVLRVNKSIFGHGFNTGQLIVVEEVFKDEDGKLDSVKARPKKVDLKNENPDSNFKWYLEPPEFTVMNR